MRSSKAEGVTGEGVPAVEQGRKEEARKLGEGDKRGHSHGEAGRRAKGGGDGGEGKGEKSVRLGTREEGVGVSRGVGREVEVRVERGKEVEGGGAGGDVVMSQVREKGVVAAVPLGAKQLSSYAVVVAGGVEKSGVVIEQGMQV